MKANVGTVDKVVRIIAGLAIIGWGVAAGNWLGAIGIVPLATALLGFCPAYSLMGVNTCGTKK
ncbi:YgaP family membrane protein [Sulfurivermis fontis]|uniref:YgaP family membrane protein n=1 Tax=Sulfurivermis fontis TaxID=1972068 RepID=UPI000FDA9DB7|nr:DUF2892 domain-containing protein [Sulfurivermis fontis]